jgi:putative ABC transport system permease protein
MLHTRPWWAAPTGSLKRPALALTALMGGALVGLVAATPTLFVDTVGTGAVQTQWNQSCPANIEPHSLATSIDPDAARRAAVGIAGFGQVNDSEVSREFTFRNGEADIVGALLMRPNAVENLPIVGEVAPGDIWISDTTATALGAAAGDVVTIDARGDGDLQAAVRGVFTDFGFGPLDDYWCAVEADLRPASLFTDLVPPPKAIVDPGASEPLRAMLRPRRTFVSFDTQPRTLADARAQVNATTALQQRLADDPANPSRRLATEGITRLTERAEAVKRSVGAAVRPLAALTLACALLVASAFGAMWARARHNDVVALSSLGIAPIWIGVKAALEAAVPTAVGAVAGGALAQLLLSVYAPATDLEPGTLRRALLFAGVCGAVLLVLIGGAAAAASRSALRTAPARRLAALRWFPWELTLGALAWRSYRSFRSGSLIELRDGDALVASAAIAFPLLCCATAGALLARLWVVSLRRSSRPMRGVATGLALRRLQHGRRLGAVFVALGTLAVGIALYGAGLVSSLDYTTSAKTGVFVGSDLSFRVLGTLPPGTDGATQVQFREDAQLNGIAVDILAIDPASFAGAAFWDESFDDRTLDELTAALAATAGPAAPALVVGADVPNDGALTNTERRPGELAIRVVGRPRMFPGFDKRPLVVISAAAAERSGFKFFNDVWAKGSLDEWQRRLTELGVRPVTAMTTSNVVNSSELLFASWTFVFVRALGAFVAGLVVVAIAMQLAARQRKQALGFGMLRRMGVSAMSHLIALALEILCLATAMYVVGAAAAGVAGRSVAPRIDPLPIIPPGPIAVTPITALAALGLATAVTAFVGASVAQRMGGRINLATALRDD